MDPSPALKSSGSTSKTSNTSSGFSLPRNSVLEPALDVSSSSKPLILTTTNSYNNFSSPSSSSSSSSSHAYNDPPSTTTAATAALTATIIDENHPLLENYDSEAEDVVTPLPTDRFLLVNLRKPKPPPRPKWVILLFVLAVIDLTIVSLCTLGLVRRDPGHWYWNNAEWDMFGLGLIRFITVVKVGSSPWLRKLGWILGGVCGSTSLYIIFKANAIYQRKRRILSHHVMLLVVSFLFCTIHMIAYVIVTADTRRRAALLRNESIEFQEEPPHNLEEDDENEGNDDDDDDDIESGTGVINTNRTRTYGTAHNNIT